MMRALCYYYTQESKKRTTVALLIGLIVLATSLLEGIPEIMLFYFTIVSTNIYSSNQALIKQRYYLEHIVPINYSTIIIFKYTALLIKVLVSILMYGMLLKYVFKEDERIILQLLLLFSVAINLGSVTILRELSYNQLDKWKGIILQFFIVLLPFILEYGIKTSAIYSSDQIIQIINAIVAVIICVVTAKMIRFVSN
ncbi:hypothetical protein [Dolosigranulum pigrum]|uniref:hypothetical protein n=1 Tax=Dolosigranulum pigrum TaxID=29394 RepID=UPI0011BD15A3|nr:hypothetical protein [Dolosigranulum pigrum]